MEKLIELRQELHKHPELSGLEINTQKRIKDFIFNFEQDLWEY